VCRLLYESEGCNGKPHVTSPFFILRSLGASKTRVPLSSLHGNEFTLIKLPCCQIYLKPRSRFYTKQSFLLHTVNLARLFTPSSISGDNRTACFALGALHCIEKGFDNFQSLSPLGATHNFNILQSCQIQIWHLHLYFPEPSLAKVALPLWTVRHYSSTNSTQ